MVNARTSRAEGERTVEMIGSNAALHIADVTKPEEVKALVDATLQRFGRLDFLVNNAAVRYETPFVEISYEEWRRCSPSCSTALSCARKRGCRT